MAAELRGRLRAAETAVDALVRAPMLHKADAAQRALTEALALLAGLVAAVERLDGREPGA